MTKTHQHTFAMCVHDSTWRDGKLATGQWHAACVLDDCPEDHFAFADREPIDPPHIESESTGKVAH